METLSEITILDWAVIYFFFSLWVSPDHCGEPGYLKYALSWPKRFLKGML